MEGCNPDTLARAAQTGTGETPTYRAVGTDEPETQAHAQAHEQIQRTAVQEDNNQKATVDERQ